MEHFPQWEAGKEYLNLDLTERLLSAAVRANRRLKAAAPREKSPPTRNR